MSRCLQENSFIHYVYAMLNTQDSIYVAAESLRSARGC